MKALLISLTLLICSTAIAQQSANIGNDHLLRYVFKTRQGFAGSVALTATQLISSGATITYCNREEGVVNSEIVIDRNGALGTITIRVNVAQDSVHILLYSAAADKSGQQVLPPVDHAVVDPIIAAIRSEIEPAAR